LEVNGVERIDCRGLSCPLPVVEARKQIKKSAPGESFEVLVETGTARDNVSRLAAKEKCAVSVEQAANEEFILTITRR
jgi:TusA-related sulfurtransferase